VTRGLAFILVLIAVLSTAACEVVPLGPAGPGDPAGPVAEPEFVCVAVPRAPCRSAISAGSDSARPPVVQLIVRCTRPICTNTEGEADVTFVFADGQRELRGYGWESAEAP
jgi:hypothetical protein